MTTPFRASTCLLVLLLTACAAPVTPPPAAVTPAPKPDAAVPPPAPPPVVVETPPAPPPPTADETARRKKELSDEAQRLASQQKNLFQVFKLTETQAGFKPKAKAVGVYELAATKGNRLKLSLAQLPNSPAKLATGTYQVTVEFDMDYTEKQECTGGACAGKSEDIERHASRSAQFTLNPKNSYAATVTLPLPDPKVKVAGNIRSSYSNLVLTVGRITAAPVN